MDALVALLVVMLGAPQARPAAARRDPAQDLASRLADFEARHKAGKPPREKRALVSDQELTAYLRAFPKLPPSLSDVEVRFERERILAKGLLDLDQLQGKLPSGGMLGAFAFLSGRVNVSVKGRLASEDGFGTFQPEEVKIGSIPLAPSVLEQIVASATRSSDKPNGINVLEPFRYPYGIRQIRLTPGRAVVEF
jgi:hypothetical protein